MRHHDEGQPEPVLQLHQLEPGVLPELAVERRERLVEQQHTGTLGQRTRQCDPLALPTGQLVRLALAETVELHEPQHLADPGVDLRAGQALLPQAERDVSGDGQVRKQRVALEHHVDRPPVRRPVRDVFAVEQDAPLVRPLEPGQHPEQRGLAASRRPQQREKLMLVDIERQPVDCRHRAEALADRIEAHQRPLRWIEPRRKSTTPAHPGVGIRVHHLRHAIVAAALRLNRLVIYLRSRTSSSCGGSSWMTNILRGAGP